ncbi:hypothetical protein T09_1525 [Trichinella sp. T9]|nr:hypothetical protein T09_1525 [Trichinella sp. T9]
MTSRIFNARGIFSWTAIAMRKVIKVVNAHFPVSFISFISDSQAEVPVSYMGRFAPHREMCKILRNVQPEIDARM